MITNENEKKIYRTKTADRVKPGDYIIYKSQCYLIKENRKNYNFFNKFARNIIATELFTNKQTSLTIYAEKVRSFGMRIAMTCGIVDIPEITTYEIVDISNNGILSLFKIDDDNLIEIKNNCLQIQKEIKILLQQNKSIKIKLLEYKEINKILSYEEINPS